MEESAAESISAMSWDLSMASRVLSSFRYQALCPVLCGGPPSGAAGGPSLTILSSAILPPTPKTRAMDADPERGLPGCQTKSERKGSVGKDGGGQIEADPKPSDQIVGRDQNVRPAPVARNNRGREMG